MRKYFKYTITDMIFIKKFLTIDFFEYDDYLSHEECHDFWEFSYVKSGEISYEVNNVTIELNTGEALFLAPLQKHRITKRSKGKTTIFFFCFECKSPIMTALSNQKIFITEKLQPFLSGIIEEASGYFNTSAKKLTPNQKPSMGGEQCVQLYFELLIINIMRLLSEQKDSNIFFRMETNKKFICQEIYNFLKENVYNKITIDDVCKEINYSRSYVSHIFKEYYGESIINCINKLKIEEAKKLILRGNLTILQIAEKLDFSDVHFFNATFKKYTGLAPSVFRNNIFVTPQSVD